MNGIGIGCRWGRHGNAGRRAGGVDVRLGAAFPGLLICGLESPPFRALTADEDAAPVARRTAPVVAAVSGDEYAVYSGRSQAVVVWRDGALSGWCML